ncbi:MAG TPA: FAD:protein FMN transferase, partial [Tenericutes bacterium]|nr:FAD:protein FMN transferase [Mycoplasmatota bacterium]
HMLTDKYNKYDGIININYINTNNSNDKYLKIDKRLYEMLEYGIKYYDITNGLININIGNITDVWKKYRDNKSGIPTYDELKNSGEIDINQIVLLDKYRMLNNKPNIDLGAISKGYTTEIVGNYLESIGINKYIINAGGNVKVGEHYKGEKYKIGVQSPIDISKTIDIVKKNNTSVVMSGDYIRNYEYDGVLYSHIIDPNTLFPANNIKSVCVVTENSGLADVLSTALFLMDIDDGKKFISDFDDVEVLWYTNDNKIIKTDGFNYNE